MRNSWILCFFCFGGLMMMGNEIRAQHARVNGTWEMKVETSAGSGSPVFTFLHLSDTTISGTYSGQLGQAEVTGKIWGKNIQFSFPYSDSRVEYEGTVEGRTMKGRVRLGSFAEGSFSGTRKE